MNIRVLFLFVMSFRFFGLHAPKDFKIIWLSNLLINNVPDESYSRNMSCTLELISTFLL